MNQLKAIFGNNGRNELSAAEANTRIGSDEPLFILDVREPQEYQMGHIEGAILIPLGELGRRVKELPTDREILCVCASGSRSGMATRQLASAGYKAINLRGGMVGWQHARYAITRGK
ncbi:MAG: rhodanese-like domain-containing protein [Chloroflexota bacterium]